MQLWYLQQLDDDALPLCLIILQSLQFSLQHSPHPKKLNTICDTVCSTVVLELLQQSDEGDKNVTSEGASGSTSRVGIMGGGECLICAASWVADVGDILLKCFPVGRDPERF